jgi:hypothetical protein
VVVEIVWSSLSSFRITKQAGGWLYLTRAIKNHDEFFSKHDRWSISYGISIPSFDNGFTANRDCTNNLWEIRLISKLLVRVICFLTVLIKSLKIFSSFFLWWRRNKRRISLTSFCYYLLPKLTQKRHKSQMIQTHYLFGVITIFFTK